MKQVLVIVALVMSASGCVGFTPALAGKTHYQMDFVDTVQAPEGEAGQNTEFHVKVSAPAGVDVTNLASMNYDWKGDGSGKIAVAGDTKADTTAQAAALVEVNRQQVEALSKAVDTISILVQSIAPIIAPMLDKPDAVAKPETGATLLELLERLKK